MPPFKITSEFRPSGDQPEAIEQLVEGVQAGEQHVTLLGATGHREDVHRWRTWSSASSARRS